MIATDTQLLLYYAVDGPFTSIAQQVRDIDDIWVAPPLWRSEFRNVLAGYIRRGMMSTQDAMAIFYDAEDLVMQDYDAPTQSVLDLVASSTCTAYDLEFVAVAQSLGIKLVTNDKEVLAAFPETAVSPAQFVA
jgi:predicted nucleic acid-binding protein